MAASSSMSLMMHFLHSYLCSTKIKSKLTSSTLLPRMSMSSLHCWTADISSYSFLKCNSTFLSYNSHSVWGSTHTFSSCGQSEYSWPLPVSRMQLNHLPEIGIWLGFWVVRLGHWIWALRVKDLRFLSKIGIWDLPITTCHILRYMSCRYCCTAHATSSHTKESTYTCSWILDVFSASKSDGPFICGMPYSQDDTVQ